MAQAETRTRDVARKALRPGRLSGRLVRLASRQDIVARFSAVLAPYLGAAMAGSSLRGQCDKLGIAEGPVSPDQLDALLASLRPGLHVFVGEAKTAEIIRALRHAVTERGSLP